MYVYTTARSADCPKFTCTCFVPYLPVVPPGAAGVGTIHVLCLMTSLWARYTKDFRYAHPDCRMYYLLATAIFVSLVHCSYVNSVQDLRPFHVQPIRALLPAACNLSTNNNNNNNDINSGMSAVRGVLHHRHQKALLLTNAWTSVGQQILGYFSTGIRRRTNSDTITRHVHSFPHRACGVVPFYPLERDGLRLSYHRLENEVGKPDHVEFVGLLILCSHSHCLHWRCQCGPQVTSLRTRTIPNTT